MDDLKPYSKKDNKLEGLLTTVKWFSDDIGMEFGLSKCAKAKLKRGKLLRISFVQLGIDTKIRELEQEETYRCIGTDKGKKSKTVKWKKRYERNAVDE